MRFRILRMGLYMFGLLFILLFRGFCMGIMFGWFQWNYVLGELGTELIQIQAYLCHGRFDGSLQLLESLHRHLYLGERKPKYPRFEYHLLIARFDTGNKIVILLQSVIILPKVRLVKWKDVFGLHSLQLKTEVNLVLLLFVSLLCWTSILRSWHTHHSPPFFLFLPKQVSAYLLQIDILDHLFVYL